MTPSRRPTRIASCSWRISSSTSRPVVVSSAPVGSSANRTSGPNRAPARSRPAAAGRPRAARGHVEPVVKTRALHDLAHPVAVQASLAHPDGEPDVLLEHDDGVGLKAWKTNPTRSRRRTVSEVCDSPARSTPPSSDLSIMRASTPAATCRERALSRARRSHDRREGAGIEVDETWCKETTAPVALAVGLGDPREPHGAWGGGPWPRSQRQSGLRVEHGRSVIAPTGRNTVGSP